MPAACDDHGHGHAGDSVAVLILCWSEPWGECRKACFSQSLPTSYTPLGLIAESNGGLRPWQSHPIILTRDEMARDKLQLACKLSQLAIIHNRDYALPPSDLADPPRPP